MDWERDRLKDKVNQWTHYIIIGVVSFLSLVFLPFLGNSVLGMTMNLPTNRAGWIVFWATKIAIATINILIFINFVQQGKVNVKDNKYYLEAAHILEREMKEERLPVSPGRHLGRVYGGKGTTLFISSMLSVFALTQAILVFDLVAFLTYLFTIIMGIVFGLMQMKNEEYYWTVEYWKYAQYMKTKPKTKKRKEDTSCGSQVTEK